MDINKINSLLDKFLQQERIFDPQYKAFQAKMITTIGNDLNTKNYLFACFKLTSGSFKDGVYHGKRTIEELKNPQKPKEKVKPKSTINNKISKKKAPLTSSKKKIKPKYVVPPSKNRISPEEAILLRQKRMYVNTPHSLSQFAEILQFELESLIDVLHSCGFENLDGNKLITIDHIIPISEQVFDQHNKIISFETEVVSKTPKTKPNYFKLIYNSPGSKR